MNAHDAVTVRVSEDTRMGLEPANRDSSPRPWEWLYVTVGHGMWAFVRTRFDVQVLGAFPTVERGQVWVSTHREETDVPVLAGAMTVLGGMRRNGNARVHFAARDDLFERGVVSAGLRLPAPLARLAWPITPGPWLPRVRAHPIRRPTGAKLGQLLADLDPDLPLERALGSDLIARFAGRAAELGRPAPLTVGAARHPVFATVLWDDVTDRGQLADTAAANWHAHTARAAADVRRLVGLAQAGEPLLLFPEGKVSPDGALGPVGEIVTLLARRGGVRQVVPVALAYDPLRRRRTTVAVHAGPPIATERMASVGGRRVLSQRRAKGRKRLSA